jgi:hypothetical protein
MKVAIESVLKRVGVIGVDVLWDDVRADITYLLVKRRPTAEERLRLLEIYDGVMRELEDQCEDEPDALTRLGYQRAEDGLLFAFAEALAAPGGFDVDVLTQALERECEAGRLRRDGYLSQAVGCLVAHMQA